MMTNTMNCSGRFSSAVLSKNCWLGMIVAVGIAAATSSSSTCCAFSVPSTPTIRRVPKPAATTKVAAAADNSNEKNSIAKSVAAAALLTLMSAFPLFTAGSGGSGSSTGGWVGVPAALANDATAATSRVVGNLKGSGLLFKDNLQIESFDDPKVRGVTLYIGNFQIPIAERIGTANFFSDPTSASVACVRTGPISVDPTIAKGPGGEQVFEESKSLLFKSLRVQRLVDEDRGTVVYVSYNTRIDKNDDSNKSRFKSSLCAINLN
jgi:catabolite regulation protein CreA